MPFPGPRPVKMVCNKCSYSYISCMEGDVFYVPSCPRCQEKMDMQSIDNSFLGMLIKQLPPIVRRQLSARLFKKKR